jgi:hypothetical protein
MKSTRSSTRSSIDRTNMSLQAEEQPLLEPTVPKGPELAAGRVFLSVTL